MFLNSSVGTRLAFGFIVVVVAMLLMAVIGLIQMQEINAHLENIVRVNNVKKDMASKLRNTLDFQAIAVRDAVILQGENRNRAITQILEGRRRGGGPGQPPSAPAGLALLPRAHRHDPQLLRGRAARIRP